VVRPQENCGKSGGCARETAHFPVVALLCDSLNPIFAALCYSWKTLVFRLQSLFHRFELAANPRITLFSPDPFISVGSPSQGKEVMEE
jgi:hypothetical protein